MQMTNSLRNLMKAHNEDTEFPYMDFLGAFLLVEKWVQSTKGEAIRRLTEASMEDLLGLPLGESMNDLKLGYVLSLIREHAKEVSDELWVKSQPSMLH
jgi:hypothetical protein